jgi:hypothetical protein
MQFSNKPKYIFFFFSPGNNTFRSVKNIVEKMVFRMVSVHKLRRLFVGFVNFWILYLIGLVSC